MANTRRVYYVGKGKEIEASEDGGKTWKTFTKCKVVDYNSTSYVWAPPGCSWEFKVLCTKHPTLRHVVTDKPMLEVGRTIAVVTGPGPEDSFLDLDALEMKEAFKAANSDGLVTEEQYERSLSADALRAKAEKLLEEAAKKETKKQSTVLK